MPCECEKRLRFRQVPTKAEGSHLGEPGKRPARPSLAKRAGHAAARASSIGGGLAPTQIVMSMLTDSAPAVANF